MYILTSEARCLKNKNEQRTTSSGYKETTHGPLVTRVTNLIFMYRIGTEFVLAN